MQAALIQHPVAAQTPVPTRERLIWIDNLRTFVILLVVNIHACVTYSHVGDWYIMEEPEPPLRVKIFFLFWQGHLQAFFMGLLFFISGVFAHKSLQKRGTGSFMRERAMRLCVPALLYMLVIHPFIVFVMLSRTDLSVLGQKYLGYITSGRFLSGNGPLWFALVLFIFCSFLVLVRQFSHQSRAEDPRPFPKAATFVIAGVLLVLATFAVRLAQPIGTNVLNFQLCFFAQYILAFAFGITCSKYHWLEPLATSPSVRVAGIAGVILGPLFLFGVGVLGGPPPEHGMNPYAGGWHPQAFGLASWEQLTGLGLGLGIMSLFRRAFDWRTAVTQWLSERSFGVYVLHPPILVGLTILFRPLAINSFTHMLLLTFAGLVFSFAAADLAKRIPGLRSIL